MKPNVLLIEDNEQNRYLITFLLENRGWTVSAAFDGPAGIAAATTAAKPPFDLVLLDIQLPTMDGHAVARALRAHPLSASIPIVAVTSYAMAGDCDSAIAAGCDGYIEKPINPETFLDQISRHLRSAPGGPSS